MSFYSPECYPGLALVGYLLHHVATRWTATGKKDPLGDCDPGEAECQCLG